MTENGEYKPIPLPSQEANLRPYLHIFRDGNVEILFFNNAVSAEESSRQAYNAAIKNGSEYIGRVIR